MHGEMRDGILVGKKKKAKIKNLSTKKGSYIIPLSVLAEQTHLGIAGNVSTLVAIKVEDSIFLRVEVLR